MHDIPDTLELLDTLISFDTISARPNLELIHWVRDLLSRTDASVTVIGNADNTKANLYATVGPADKPGVLLSGHTDVVPVEGQQWTTSPFAMAVKHGKAYGRGTADMKGFVACALRTLLLASTRQLTTPLHLALSYDEEIGCVGVHSMLDMLAQAPFTPLMCIVGEPTELEVAIGHKGKTACHVTCTGRAAHSSLAPQALNAIHLATDFIHRIRQLQERLRQSGARDDAYDVPYTTLHVSNIHGGVALNIVPDSCRFDMEIRNLAEDNPESLMKIIRDDARQLTAAAQTHVEEANIELDLFNTYPGLDTGADESVVSFVQSLTQSNDTTKANGTMKVTFGTEAGLFSSKLRIPSVVCGPGSMQQGHKPDEFIALDQLERCDVMLGRLLDCLEVGI